MAQATRRVSSLGVTASAGLGEAVPRPTVRRGVRLLGRAAPWAPAAEAASREPVAWWRMATGAVATFVVIVVAGLAILASAPSALGYRPVVVASGSMRPAIQVADVVVTVPSSGDRLAPGTVIDYITPDGTRIHRVTEVVRGGYRAKGDANRSDDTQVVKPAQIRGVGVMVVPFIGWMSLWFDRGMWIHLFLATASLVAALFAAGRHWGAPQAAPPSR